MAGHPAQTVTSSGGRSPTKSNVLPDFRSVRTLFTLVVVAQLLAFILVLAANNSTTNIWNSLSLTSLFIQWVTLSSIAVLYLLSPLMNRLSMATALTISYAVLLAVTAFFSLLSCQLLPPDMLRGRWLTDGQLGFLLRNMGISAVVSAITLHYFQLQHRWREQLQLEATARLQALQARIRPHFLFNSMNTIAHLTRTQPEKAEEVVQDLADLFRVSLASEQRTQISLGEEILLARQYLSIEQYRLGDRLRVAWQVEALPKNALLPPLSLQPLLENAVYHGIETAPQGGEVQILGQIHRKELCITISNTLPPTKPSQLRPGNHMALNNISERLETFFQGRGKLVISVVEQRYQVRIIFPYWTQRL